MTFEASVRCSSQRKHSRAGFSLFDTHAMFDTVRVLSKYVSATAIARRGFGFTSVSRGAKTARYSGGWHRGRGTPPRDENKIRLAVARRENPLIARAAKIFEPRSAMLRYKDTR